MNFLGIEIGGSKLQISTGTAEGIIIDRQRMVVDHNGGGERIRDQIKSVIERIHPQFKWNAVGVGYGGPVDWKSGRICCSHHVGGWDDFPLSEWLHGLTGLPVTVDNDSNVAALAEARLGVGAGMNPVFYTNSGSGVGGGLVVDGKIYHGFKPGEAEFGHIRLDREGTLVEERCSGWAVDRLVRESVAEEPDSILARLSTESGHTGARTLTPALAAHCPIAGRILEQTAEDLAFALSHVVHLFHPEVIVLGGGLSLIGEPWRAAVARLLPRFVMRALAPGPEIRLSGLGEDIVPAGALLLAMKAGRNSE